MQSPVNVYEPNFDPFSSLFTTLRRACDPCLVAMDMAMQKGPPGRPLRANAYIMTFKTDFIVAMGLLHAVHFAWVLT